MFRTLFVSLSALVLLTASEPSSSQSGSSHSGPSSSQPVRVEAEPASGFHWPYIVYVPPALKNNKGARRTILVLPNNTGSANDDFAVHERSAMLSTVTSTPIAGELGVVLLRPVFPRPMSNWRIYTHALDRDALLTKEPKLQRLDLQLLAMIDHVTRRLSGESISVDKRIVMIGYSASGMFVNRFVILHPERVKAAAIGSPGGWPIAPVEKWNGKRLTYPIGIGDLESVSGAPFRKRLVEKLPLFVFMGADDTNDSVVFGDSYEPAEKELVFALFGKTPVERWPVAEAIYRKAIPTSEFKLYPSVGHKPTKEMMGDVVSFLSKHLGD